MRSPRLGSLVLPIAAALLLTLAVRLSLRCVGENLVPLLRRGPSAETLWPLLRVVLHAFLAAVATHLWRRAPRDRRARIAGAVAAAASVALSYLVSGEPSTRGDFHGLLTPVPGSSVVEGGSSKGPLRYAINAHGFRAPDFTTDKPRGTLRIALIGGSFVFGAGVEQEHTLASALGVAAAARWPERRIEALNLGVSGDNLPSHRRVIELAHTALDADVSVLCLLLPGELSAWDGQNERRAPLHVDTFSVVSWALGMQTARFFWSLGEEDRAFTPARLALLDAELDRLRGFRREHGERPLLVLGYEALPAEVRARFGALPGVTLVSALEQRDGAFLPGNGHPSAEGNAAFARLVMESLVTLPAFAAAPAAP